MKDHSTISAGLACAACLASLTCVGVGIAQEQRQPTEPKHAEDERKLGERLIREASGEHEDLMAKIIRLMDLSTRKLELQFDPGRETQDVQARIVEQLDEAIETAAARRRLRRQTAPPQGADKRRMARDQQRQRREQREARNTAAGRANAGTTAPAQTGSTGGARGRLRETRRAWGHLPIREREELIQGSEEAFLEEYRVWIERYYRALQEAE